MTKPLTKKDLQDLLRPMAKQKDLEAIKKNLASTTDHLDESIRGVNLNLTKQLAAAKDDVVSELTAGIGKLADVLATRPQLEQLIAELHKHGVKVDRKAIFAD